MLISSGKAILMRLAKHMILARNEKPSIAPPAGNLLVAGIF